MLVESVVLLAGFLMNYVLYARLNVKSGGIVAAPIFALYLLYAGVENVVGVAAVFAMITLIVYSVGWILYSTVFVYGRRLLIQMAGVSLLISLAVVSLSGQLRFDWPMTAFISIVPALFAYNTMTNGRKGVSALVLVGMVLTLYLLGLYVSVLV